MTVALANVVSPVPRTPYTGGCVLTTSGGGAMDAYPLIADHRLDR